MTALADRRAMILDRLFEILKGLTIDLTVGTIPSGRIVRNRDELPKELVPGIILLDGDETKDPRFPQNSGRGLPVSPGMMRMSPEVYVVLDVRKPQNANAGEDLNLARAVILNAVLHDKTLGTIVGSNGSIVFDGAYTDLARNRQMKGQMGLAFTFVYPFIPTEFKPA